jgi:hypothetical protein
MMPEEQVSLGLSHAVQSQYLMGNAYQVSEVTTLLVMYAAGVNWTSICQTGIYHMTKDFVNT